jgi:molybdate transport system ATP-binding protein
VAAHPDLDRPVSLSVSIARRLSAAFSLEVAFEAPARGVTALFGVSGAGKSATLAAIAGASNPDTGRIVLNDRVLFDSARGLDLPMERRGIGWVFQDARLFPHMDVKANLDYGARRARGRPVVAGFDEVVEVLGIAALLGRRPRELSGGERQRAAIGRALLSQPALLLMDEPLAALDAPRKAEILPFLEQVKSRFDLPVLYVAHALSEVVRLADRMVVIDAGRVVAQGPLAELMTRPDLPLLSARADAGAVLPAVVEAHDLERGISRLRASGAALITPRLGRAVGEQVRVLVLARDVLLSLTRLEGLSARNLLAARVDSLTPRGDAVLVRLTLDGGQTLLSQVTRDAAAELALEPGLGLWAVVKSVAVEGAGDGGLLAALDD